MHFVMSVNWWIEADPPEETQGSPANGIRPAEQLRAVEKPGPVTPMRDGQVS
jgi:hypothetical protein